MGYTEREREREREREIQSKAAIQSNEWTGFLIAPQLRSAAKTAQGQRIPPHLADESEQVQGSDRRRRGEDEGGQVRPQTTGLASPGLKKEVRSFFQSAAPVEFLTESFNPADSRRAEQQERRATATT